MKIEAVAYTYDALGYAYMEFLLDGQPVKVAAAAMKRSVLKLGYAYLGSAWSKKVPPMDVVIGDKSFRMTGGIKNEHLAKLELRFLDGEDAELKSSS